MLSLKIPALLGQKSHAYISEKVGRSTIIKIGVMSGGLPVTDLDLELKEGRWGAYLVAFLDFLNPI